MENVSAHDEKRFENLKILLGSRMKIILNQAISGIEKGEDFYIDTENWQERQALHIFAQSRKWFSRKEDEIVSLSDWRILCLKCRVLWEERGTPNNCCMLHDGICPKCKDYDSDFQAHGNAKVFLGRVLFSQKPLKLGKKARRRRNNWRKGFVVENQ